MFVLGDCLNKCHEPRHELLHVVPADWDQPFLCSHLWNTAVERCEVLLEKLSELRPVEIAIQMILSKFFGDTGKQNDIK